MSEWQPIETAPKDGTVIDLWVEIHDLADRDSDKTICYVSFRVPCASWYDCQWRDEDGNQLAPLEGYEASKIRFTHWMPLPPAPADRKGE